ncbi:hypothetical protein JQS43_12665 [Natronosporangium hydrolyticum]|uniref:PIN domain-containing protein n=1 Tax=Natronosporangium hydrolyticum TaxID=2811111 RepID=A0A895YFX9_9ACTN|nr:hypothetical protein [Natronosporangium hydrolyticum]QSB12578.1 hypothetical protein JQS43_12665 [Natronosporangium hydrolyticum]
MRYYWIFDTPALVGHANGTSNRVRAGLLVLLDEPDFQLTVPALCLAEAYQQTPAETHHLLDWLATSPGVVLEPVGDDPREMAALGELIAETGRPGAAHAAHLALAGDGPCIVFTDEQLPAGVLARPA